MELLLCLKRGGEMDNIICYDSLGNQVTRLYQWDVNQLLTIKGVVASPLPVFQFSNRKCGTTISVTPTVSGSDLIVAVPNVLLEKAEPIFAFIYRKQETGAGRTIGAIHIPVKPRVKPSTGEYVEPTNNE